jgi:chromosome partitioning protein
MTSSLGRIVLVCKLKGGAGATTTCRELAAAAAGAGLQVGLIDLDSQGGLTRWWSRRTKGQKGDAVNPQLLHLSPEHIVEAASGLRNRYALTIIDSPPTVHETIRTVGAATDLALIPSRPTVDDLDAVGPIARLLRGDGAEALERLASLAPVLGRTSLRLDYPRPAGVGSTGFEEGGAPKEEIGELWAAVSDRLGLRYRDTAVTLSRDNVVAE